MRKKRCPRPPRSRELGTTGTAVRPPRPDRFQEKLRGSFSVSSQLNTEDLHLRTVTGLGDYGDTVATVTFVVVVEKQRHRDVWKSATKQPIFRIRELHGERTEYRAAYVVTAPAGALLELERNLRLRDADYAILIEVHYDITSVSIHGTGWGDKPIRSRPCPNPDRIGLGEPDRPDGARLPGYDNQGIPRAEPIRIPPRTALADQCIAMPDMSRSRDATSPADRIDTRPVAVPPVPPPTAIKSFVAGCPAGTL